MDRDGFLSKMRSTSEQIWLKNRERTDVGGFLSNNWLPLDQIWPKNEFDDAWKAR